MPKETKVHPKMKQAVQYPAKFLASIGDFLKDQLKRLERRRAELEEDDPFQNGSRPASQASPDDTAAVQFGHARVSAMKDEVDKRIIQTRKALTRVKIGDYGICENCGNMIDTDRLMVYPEATLCIKCGRKREK